MTEYTESSEASGYSMMDIEPETENMSTGADILWQQQLEDTEQEIIKEKEGKRAGSDTEGEPALKKKATEFDKFWSSVVDNPHDFQAWTVLLQYVDQNSEIDEGRKAYDKFFERYPYCYGYWKKFSDLEKRKGTHETTMEVFSRGLIAIPLSVDLWIHYLEYVAAKFEENEDYVREQYERSIEICGLEFRSDRLWDSYIAWETRMTSTFGLQRVVSLYDRLLATPISKYLQHWQKFEEFVKNYLPSELLSAEEYQKIRKMVVKEEIPKIADGVEAPPGEESTSKDTVISALDKEEETKQIQNHIIKQRESIHEHTSVEAKSRWTFEDAIKRPYFHVKPLEKSQLAAWRAYIQFEISQGDDKRTKTLFERCLIACALYEEFWILYIEYLETKGAEEDEIRSVFTRLCCTHLPNKVKPHAAWAAYEEELGNTDRAIEILKDLQDRIGLSVEAQMSLIGIYRRLKNEDSVEQAFQSCLENFRMKGDPDGYCSVIVKRARYINLFGGSAEKALDCIKEALALFKDNGKLLLALSETALMCRPPKIDVAAEALRTGTKDTLDGESRVAFAFRYTHFMMTCGDSAQLIREAMKLQRETLADVRSKQAAVEQVETPAEKVDEFGTQKAKAVTTSESTEKTVNGTATTTANGSQAYPSYPNQTGYGTANYSQAYGQNFTAPQQYPNWNYSTTPQQGSYNYNQQQWGNYPNYYGQQR